MVLRILTTRSTLKFSKFALLTVQQLIDLHRIGYLIWVYCNCSHIGFHEDILKNEFHLPDDERIPKPGVRKGTEDKYKTFYWNSIRETLSETEYMHLFTSMRKSGKRDRKSRNNKNMVIKKLNHYEWNRHSNHKAPNARTNKRNN